ncbi:MAG: response regulator transcription factor [Acidimicrobiia bacterium]
MSLSKRGYDVTVDTTGSDALERCRRQLPDVIVLDLGLPDVDGIEVCRLLRRWATVPIIVLTADGSEDRMIAALDNGADDYVTKPFSMPQLDARVRVALRHRSQQPDRLEGEPIVLGPLTVDIAGYRAVLDGEHLELTRREFSLLALFAQHPGRVLTTSFLLEHGWGPEFTGNVATLRNRVVAIRRILGRHPAAPQIATEAGTGYRLVLPGDARSDSRRGQDLDNVG